jgi:hypothetical protein
MKEAGIAAVVAPTFGRLFTRNAINVGLPIVTSPRIDEEIAQGDVIEIDLVQGVLRNLRSGYAVRLPPMAPESLRLIEDGGIAAYTRRVLEERRRAKAETQCGVESIAPRSQPRCCRSWQPWRHCPPTRNIPTPADTSHSSCRSRPAARTMCCRVPSARS